MTLGSNRCLSFLQNCIENDNPDSQTVRIQRIHIEKKGYACSVNISILLQKLRGKIFKYSMCSFRFERNEMDLPLQ